MGFKTIEFDCDDHVATITLNRPERLNAITLELTEELVEAMRTAGASDDVRVIVLTGAGRGFCAGADLEVLQNVSDGEMSAVDPDELLERLTPDRPFPGTSRDFQRTHSYCPAVDKPIIAAVNGVAVGLGLVLSLYCDMRFASERARFGTAFAQRGLIAEHGCSWLLPRLVGLSNAFDLLYSARLIDAPEALRMGMVSRVFPPQSLMTETQEYAKRLATTVSPRSLRVIKRQVWSAQLQGLGEAIDEANKEMMQSFECEDFQEGIAHYLEKRPPRFSGR